MEEASLLYFLKNYIKDHKKLIIFFVLAVAIFGFIIGLYKLPMAAVGYAAALCILVAVVFFIYDFYFYTKKNRALILKVISVKEMLDDLPEPKTFSEKNWETLLELSHEGSIEKQKNDMAKMEEMIDYYTMWAHQIKTPIAAMRLLLQSPEGSIPPGIHKELTGELFKIEQYVDMVLSYMRLESNSTDYVFKKYDLDSIIKQSVKKYSTAFINNKISLNYENTNLTVLTDEKWLGFALEQILSNATKYTDEGTVTIKKPPGLKDNEKIIQIEDTGIGISSSDLPRIFEKGYTGYNGRVSKKSTGIGLFLTNKILTKLGHTIKIESVPGQGTRVILNLTESHIRNH